MKQLGLALHNRHDTRKAFPKGCVWNSGNYYDFPRSGWNYSLFPFMEQQPLYAMFPASAGTQQWYPWFSPEATNPNGPTRVVIETWVCPSDSGVSHNNQPWGSFSLGNYHAVFTGMNLEEARQNPPNRRAAFAVNWGARFSDFLDGTSNTMVLAEYLRSQGASNDQRGMPWGDQPGYGQVYTQLSPNSASPDFIYVGWCDNKPNQNLPCINGDSGPNNHVAVRSRHPTGVNVTLGDGAVRFVSNNVDLVSVWRPLATLMGGETIGEY
jgi:hypothetical protein